VELNFISNPLKLIEGVESFVLVGVTLNGNITMPLLKIKPAYIVVIHLKSRIPLNDFVVRFVQIKEEQVINQ